MLSAQADQENFLIRRIAMASGTVTTLAGVAGITGNTDGIGPAALFNKPKGLALDAAGNIALVVSARRTINLCMRCV